MSNYNLSTAPTLALLAELKKRGFDVDFLANQLAGLKPEKQGQIQEVKVIPIAKRLKK